ISIREATEELFAKAIDTNVKGPLFFSKLAQPYLEKAQKEADAIKNGGSPLGGSRIINISSVGATVSDPIGDYLLYTITKGAMNQLTRVLARDEDFGAKGITVNGIAPGGIYTDAVRQFSDPLLQAAAASAPQKRLGEVEDIADVVIINISSGIATVSDPQGDNLLYPITKGALNQLTRVLAGDEDFGAKGITVNGIAPGLALLANTPQKRLGEVEDIADVVSFLAINESRWVNGQTNGANGGSLV
ncbi:hypothetical protein BGZ68_003076, partial [Mortierella alpina]